MVLANPALLFLLGALLVDLFIDATFKCCPHPFYQCLIVMVFDRESNLYVPVMYILMTHKTAESYACAFHQIIVHSRGKLNVRNFTCDFEQTMFNAGKISFPWANHIGCLFHLKQAWRRRLISWVGFLDEEVSYGMRKGVLDLLRVIPQYDIVEPNVRVVLISSKHVFIF